MEVPESEVHQYGVIKGEEIENGFTRSKRPWKNRWQTTRRRAWRSSAAMCCGRRSFEILQKLPPGRGGEIQLTDGLAQLVRERKIFGCEFVGDRYDIGDKFGFVRATVAYALKRPDLKDKVLEYLKIHPKIVGL